MHRQPVACFAPNDKAAAAFEVLWSEVEEHVGLGKRLRERARGWSRATQPPSRFKASRARLAEGGVVRRPR